MTKFQALLWRAPAVVFLITKDVGQRLPCPRLLGDLAPTLDIYVTGFLLHESHLIPAPKND